MTLTDIGLRFGEVQALTGINLRISRGERVALVGANGSGKSTLLRVLHGLLTPTRGERLLCVDCTQAMLFQRPHMLRTSALNNVALGLWLQGTHWRASREQALAALQRVGLADLAGRNAKALSGGQQQRLALARAWSVRPDVLLLDEPTASLDPNAKRDVEALVADLGQQMTLVFSSHNLGQVKRLASRVVYLEQGRLLADLPVDEFFNGTVLPHKHPEAHLFVTGETA
ncbi:MAG TPA: phosphate ABC transporter ATP-binding protein [Burkholderiaceae bacterium]|nr:phosphate ABC transporter ATP-binding protein [Burkholderiaceae bacterium]